MRAPEPAQVLGARAELQLEDLGPPEVAVDRVLDVEADAAVEVLGGVGDPVPAVGGPVLGDVELLVGGSPLGEAPGGLAGGELHALGVDVGVGHALADGLEGADLGAELLALGDVGGGDARWRPRRRRRPSRS